LLQSALYSLVNPLPVEEEEAFLPASLRGKTLNPYHEALEQLLLLKETSEGKHFLFSLALPITQQSYLRRC